jgi:hypothetical protein
VESAAASGERRRTTVELSYIGAQAASVEASSNHGETRENIPPA